MLFAGIDEAGYGPLLGPLVVAAAAFRARDCDDARSLSERLRGVARSAGLPLGDSKRVFGGGRDLAALERPVLAFAAAAGTLPPDLDGLLAAFGADASHRRSVPWYAGAAGLPCRVRREDVEPAARDLRARLGDAGLEFLGFAADVVPERRLNDGLGGANKADLLFAASADVFARATAGRAPGEAVDAVFDRQGGRRYYSPLLQRRFPDGIVWSVDEGVTTSDYRVSRAGGADTLRFHVGADAEYLHVALASMAAKYLREVHMDLFNAHFAPLCPGVAPTAGYTEDGRRWLAATRAARASAGIPDSELVRAR